MTRPTGIALAATLALGVAVPVHGQSDPAMDVFFDGVPSSLNEWANRAGEAPPGETPLGPEFRKAVREWKIADSDIAMFMMEAGDPTAGYGQIDPSLPLYYRDNRGDGSLYAEFDWANLRTSMEMWGSEGGRTLALNVNDQAVPLATADGNGPQGMTIYFFEDGTVMVPICPKRGGVQGRCRYQDVNLATFAAGMTGDVVEMLDIGVDVLIESRATLMLDVLVNHLVTTRPISTLIVLHLMGLPALETMGQYAGDPAWDDATGEYVPGVTETMLDAWRQDLVDHIGAQYERLRVFPPLIHWALILSPAAVEASGTPVHPETGISCTDLHGNSYEDCTRLTVSEGPDAGAVAIFDRYDRLVSLRDPEGGEAFYGWDVDLTVVPLPANEAVGLQ